MWTKELSGRLLVFVLLTPPFCAPLPGGIGIDLNRRLQEGESESHSVVSDSLRPRGL